MVDTIEKYANIPCSNCQHAGRHHGAAPTSVCQYEYCSCNTYTPVYIASQLIEAEKNVPKEDSKAQWGVNQSYRNGYDQGKLGLNPELYSGEQTEWPETYMRGFYKGYEKFMEHFGKKGVEVQQTATGPFHNIQSGVDDPVNHPSHYTSGKIEVADFIADKELDFFLGNVVKYVARAGRKAVEKTREDLEKARWYLNYKIVELGGVNWNSETPSEKTQAQIITSQEPLTDREATIHKIAEVIWPAMYHSAHFTWQRAWELRDHDTFTDLAKDVNKVYNRADDLVGRGLSFRQTEEIANNLLEVEPRQPAYNPIKHIIRFPQQEGVAYYIGKGHFVGELRIYVTTDVTAVALPGYIIPQDIDHNWFFVV